MSFKLLSLTLILAVSLVCGCEVLAQPAPNPEPPKTQTLLDQFAQRINLTADQKSKVNALLDEHGRALKALRQNMDFFLGTEKERLKKLNEVQDSTNEKVKSILTSEQFALYMGTSPLQPQQRDGKIVGRVISATTLDCNRENSKACVLSNDVVISLDGRGIVRSNDLKSGWISMNTTGQYKDETGLTHKLRIYGVSFWVNQSGRHWWDFEVKEVKEIAPTSKYPRPEDVPLEMQTDIPFETGTETISDGIRPVIILKGEHKLVPAGSLNNLSFKE